MASSWQAPALLVDRFVRLEALCESHRALLQPLSADPDMWRWGPIDEHGGPFARWFDVWFARAWQAHESGREMVFVVRGVDGAALGTTRYLSLSPENARIEVGATYYRPEARGTFVNPACKRLLFAHAFERLGCGRVELKCDARNLVSRRAIAKVGAREEGTLRKHMKLGDGYVRDSVYFSVVADEWPVVRAALDVRLGDV